MIAIARNHPEAEAVRLLGYAGLLPTVYPWMQAFIWAFKPTNVIDIRRFPAEEAKATDAEIAQLLAESLPFDESALGDRTEAVRIASVQYLAGRRDLLWVSNLQTTQIATEAALIRLRGLQRVNRVRLLLALGGSFDAVPAAATQPIQ
ncbi:MAG: hypothetical protein ABW056_00020 [Thermoanaerobaculia bacterium]